LLQFHVTGVLKLFASNQRYSAEAWPKLQLSWHSTLSLALLAGKKLWMRQSVLMVLIWMLSGQQSGPAVDLWPLARQKEGDIWELIFVMLLQVCAF